MKRKAPAPKKQNAKPDKVRRMVSIPRDVVLSPQTQAPPHMRGQDRSARRSRVIELAWTDFDAVVQSLAREVSAAYEVDAVVGVAHGGVFVGGAIASALGAEFFPVRISRRSRDKQARPKLSGEMPKELKRKKVLIVDDVVSSGDTLELARALALKVGAVEVKTLCLVAREGGYEPDWSGYSTDELVIFPWDYQTVAEDDRFEVDPDKAGA